jgi:RND family efflux transporter MFP subunit
MLAAAAALVLAGWTVWPSDDLPDLITATASRTNLPITVTERGELDSSKTVDLRCEVEGYNIKVIEILAEGTEVKAGDVLLKFDTEELSRKHAEQEIKAKQAEAKAGVSKEELEVAKNKAASEVATATLALKLATLDRDKYLEGDYRVEEENLKGEIALAEHDLQQSLDELEHNRRMVKKGYATLDGLRQLELAIERWKYNLDRDKAKLDVLRRFTRQRQETELTAKAEEAARELERVQRSSRANVTKAETDLAAAEVTAELEKRQLEKLQTQLDKCAIVAPQAGILVYSKERYWDPDSFVRPGAMVDFQQKLVSLPDLTQMQVKVKVHESVIKKVKQGQKAEIRVDAFPDEVLSGTVESVATLADSSESWRRGGVKEYETVVKVDQVAGDGGIRPGMTAEVKILVDVLNDRLVVPVSAVTANKADHFTYVVAGSQVEKTKVEVGANNTTHVEIKSGLNDGARVALDARVRMDAELKDSDELPAAAPAEKPAEQSPSTPVSTAAR